MDEDEACDISPSDGEMDDSRSDSDGGCDIDPGIDISEVSSSNRKRNLEIHDDFSYVILDPGQISAEMDEAVKQVSAIINVQATSCRILLSHFKWNSEKLLDTYYEKDVEKLFKDACIVSPLSRQMEAGSSNRAAIGPNPKIINQKRICDICFELETGSSIKVLVGLACGHLFCPDCWDSYLTTKIMDEGKGDEIFCPAFKCNILVDDERARNSIKDEAVRIRYMRHIANNFVESNRLLRWCPSPDCIFAVKASQREAKPINCKCGACFCFSCGSDWHEPINCRLLKLWIKRCSDDSETSNWINANTKECPRCHATIEKDGGCNHMTCRKQNCKMEFCWLCLGPWEPHGSSWYACNRFDDSAAKLARDAQERSRAALQRYLHYCNRYAAHMNSMKLEHKLYAQVKSKMEQMQQLGMSWIETQFLQKAVDILCNCRRTLMYTYAFAFYLKRTNQSIIFEDNQKDLEMATEQLSGFLERDLDKDTLPIMKTSVQDKYKYCENRRAKLLEHCNEGEERGWWDYSE